MIGTATMRLHLGLLIVLTAVACGDDLPEGPPQEDEGESCDASMVNFACSSSSSSTSTPGTTSTDGGVPMTSESSSGGSSTSTAGPSTVGIPDECAVSADCPDGGFCVAPFVPEFGPQGKQPSECVAECVVLVDELRWCFDAVACCDPDAVCTDRGYCELPEDSTGGDTTSGDTTSGGSDSSG